MVLAGASTPLAITGPKNEQSYEPSFLYYLLCMLLANGRQGITSEIHAKFADVMGTRMLRVAGATHAQHRAAATIRSCTMSGYKYTDAAGSIAKDLAGGAPSGNEVAAARRGAPIESSTTVFSVLRGRPTSSTPESEKKRQQARTKAQHKMQSKVATQIVDNVRQLAVHSTSGNKSRSTTLLRFARGQMLPFMRIADGFSRRSGCEAPWLWPACGLARSPGGMGSTRLRPGPGKTGAADADERIIFRASALIRNQAERLEVAR